MVIADLAFENIPDDQILELSGGCVIGTILSIAGTLITLNGIYETGKDHIYDYYYDKAYKAETARLERIEKSQTSSSYYGGGGVSYLTLYQYIT
ncbi:hypothetical protein DFR55_101212 [Herbinix hemicellulosilytica]|uniref:Putative membrane protein n=1 Tax=Herbinix hemicellulosilytica TaxID=1564487 RepID=A0A0H5SG46_HERHM|nr:hypothetical protein [Herbinix hemicellulosilytica]RBP60752.1 hypothetical protein DFR55_101212 [Herbinix hemicellulosilytica]CRZ34439.1 putative membrane protein [Herbinix hemicellulosilytica]